MGNVKKYLAKVEDIKKPIIDIYTVTFSTDKGFKYLPGQFLHLALDEYDGIGQWPESRCFSMQSSPDEDILKISYSIKGNFTKRMERELKVGKEIWLKLPYGDIFDRGHSKENCVFIAGGTGITPFLSLFLHKNFISYTNPVLFLGIRNEQYNIYMKELEKALEVNNRLRINLVNQNEVGYLSIEKIINESNKSSTFFISGPNLMIRSFKEVLIRKNISENKIITDDWD